MLTAVTFWPSSWLKYACTMAFVPLPLWRFAAAELLQAEPNSSNSRPKRCIDRARPFDMLTSCSKFC